MIRGMRSWPVFATSNSFGSVVTMAKVSLCSLPERQCRLVIAQGRIRVDLGKASYVFGQSKFLLTSLELPAVSQVTMASEKAPYLAFFLKLDISTVRDILNTEEVHIPEATCGACG